MRLRNLRGSRNIEDRCRSGGRRAGRVPQPHSFTLGTSEQRARWFGRGYQTGEVNDCDTVRARAL